MSDPTDNPGSRKPPRAEPVQPDAPARGTDRQTPGKSGGDPGGGAQKEQSEDALENVREGYA